MRYWPWTCPVKCRSFSSGSETVHLLPRHHPLLSPDSGSVRSPGKKSTTRRSTSCIRPRRSTPLKMSLSGVAWQDPVSLPPAGGAVFPLAAYRGCATPYRTARTRHSSTRLSAHVSSSCFILRRPLHGAGAGHADHSLQTSSNRPAHV